MSHILSRCFPFFCFEAYIPVVGLNGLEFCSSPAGSTVGEVWRSVVASSVGIGRPRLLRGNQIFGRDLAIEGECDAKSLTIVFEKRKPGLPIGRALFAVSKDRSLEVWGDAQSGGLLPESVSQSILLEGGVDEVVFNYAAAAVLTMSGRVYCWGDPRSGGDCSSVAETLSHLRVSKVVGTFGAFAALTVEGKVVTWGKDSFGGDSSSVRAALMEKRVVEVFATGGAFAALDDEGDMVTWGDWHYGGILNRGLLKEGESFCSVCGNDGSFSGLTEEGKLCAWGNVLSGACLNATPPPEDRYTQVRCSGAAFAAISATGKLFTWGNSNCGGTSASIREVLQGKKVLEVCGSYKAFAAIVEEEEGVSIRSVISWGSKEDGGDSSRVSSQLVDVIHLYSTGHAFAALLRQGAVVVWGDSRFGGDASSVQEFLKSDVVSLNGNAGAFVALKEDGSVISWGCQALGGKNAWMRDLSQKSIISVGY